MSGTAKNFLKVLYESIVPEEKHKKLTEAQPEKLTAREGTVPESWESYRHHQGAVLPSTAGINRRYYQYSTPLAALSPLGSDGVGKYMTNQFNAYCSEAGVQCTVQMDPTDFQRIFIFHNKSDKLVRIAYGSRVEFLEPNEEKIIRMRPDLMDKWNCVPRITPLNQGVDR